VNTQLLSCPDASGSPPAAAMPGRKFRRGAVRDSVADTYPRPFVQSRWSEGSNRALGQTSANARELRIVLALMASAIYYRQALVRFSGRETGELSDEGSDLGA